MVTCSASREYSRINCNVSLQNTSEAALFVSRGLAKVVSSSHIGSAVSVLSTRIAKIDLFRINDLAITLFRLVMDDCAVRSGCRNGIERQADVVSLFCTEFLQLVSCIHLVQLHSRCQLFLQPCKESHKCCAVTKMAFAHAIKLCLVLDSLGIVDHRAFLQYIGLWNNLGIETPTSARRHTRTSPTATSTAKLVFGFVKSFLPDRVSVSLSWRRSSNAAEYGFKVTWSPRCCLTSSVTLEGSTYRMASSLVTMAYE